MRSLTKLVVTAHINHVFGGALVHAIGAQRDKIVSAKCMVDLIFVIHEIIPARALYPERIASQPQAGKALDLDSASLSAQPCNTSSAEKDCPGVYQSLMERIYIWPEDKYRLKPGTASTIRVSATSASNRSEVTHRHDSLALRPASK
jgi:hypothetical protein